MVHYPLVLIISATLDHFKIIIRSMVQLSLFSTCFISHTFQKPNQGSRPKVVQPRNKIMHQQVYGNQWRCQDTRPGVQRVFGARVSKINF